MDIQIKRIYDPPGPADGIRILVDRLWPRGLSKERAAVDYWAKAISPSDELRRWYGHEPDKWEEFKARYFEELGANPEGVRELRQQLDSGPVTFLYSSKEERLNNAVALRQYLAEEC
ncbi:hypothetical protein DESUT3_16790 [Desulfuromonas versatilis]|uniref:DUF488 domain-containing protein n=1 Tax=Desulfuromonas versatilis TaxID=2802975 RepID=A0ABM8HVR1_9BACT|nr:DUF488 domain-containing protein [Desulfuromonas versatilis]BCR04610.1 hypothetical protein DESUT3_16790 [Desulfuromonas versatilis]